MRNLFRFIATYRLTFLFLLLQICSFTLLFRANSYQNALFFHSAQKWTAKAYQWQNSISQYFQLKEKNEELARENERLRQKLLRYREDRTFKLLPQSDSARRKRYKIIHARVINSSVHRRNNYLTIDRGKKNGVTKDMGIVGPNGIVGVVRDLSEHFATALPILNPNFRASIKLKKNDQIGLLKWNGGDPTRARMKDVAQHVKVQKGDSVVTRGASGIFPSGIPVGRVEKVKTDPSRNYHRIELKLFTDFSKLHHVYLIEDRLRAEKEALEKKNGHGR
ncbi:MAG: rod shape-determining protein MreC [Flavobacteriales bacterium]